MRLKEITLRGFRGFNVECTIPLHDRITLISAPNSHGKTSISEGFEWLLYGYTSKVQFADSKDEYKGSYRNIHLLAPESPSVKVVVQDGSVTTELLAILSGSDALLRIDGAVVPAWPFAAQLNSLPKPFILQHALKDLLLAAPVDRFNRFAALLGFEDLTQVHKDLMAFCTKPPMPLAAKELIAAIDGLMLRVQADPQLAAIARSMKKGHQELPATRKLISNVARKLVRAAADDAALLPELIKTRDAATAKFFRGTVAVVSFTDSESDALAADQQSLLALVTSELPPLVATLATDSAQHKILREAEFYGLGLSLLENAPTVCPFCDRKLKPGDVAHIRERHGNLMASQQAAAGLQGAQKEITRILDDLGQRVSDYYKRIGGRAKALLEAKGALPHLQALLGAKHEHQLTVILTGIEDIGKAVAIFVQRGQGVRAGIKAVESLAQQPSTDLSSVEQLGQALVDYLAAGSAAKAAIEKHAASLMQANRVLSDELNAVAGTGTISLVIELIENDQKLEKRLKLAGEIENLKNLKTDVDAFVTNIMLQAISGELADDVMAWYKRIRTVGDPDVHFAGFDMKKTPQGGRVQIKASSYGKDLVSAVSSLSESKLNALGLCISIAINLKEKSPFEFLIIDDPIQSWDKDHENQFINVIRELVERGKQIVLLSHNGEWIKQVRTGCADFNGLYYEITGYTEEGPVIQSFSWVEPKQRLQTILALIEDQTADSIRLQQAEEELRQVLNQLSCTLHEGVKGVPRNPATLNSEKVQKILTECGIATSLVNRVMLIFETLDDAHHAAPGYSPNRQKLRQYYETAMQLSQAIEARLKERKKLTVIPPKTA